MQRLLAQLLLIAALLAGCKNDVIVPDGPPVDGYDQPAHLEITTDDLKEITSKGEYTGATFSLTGVPRKAFRIISTTGAIGFIIQTLRQSDSASSELTE